MRKNKFSKWIERLLVLLPLFYVAISSAYAIFNKNAKDSYSDTYIDDFTQVNTSDLVLPNSNYMVTYNANNTSLGNIIITPNSTDLTDYITLQEGQFIKYFILMNDNNTPRIQITLNDDSQTRIMNWQNVCPTFYFNLSSMSSNYFNTSFTTLYLITRKENTLNNVLTYSMSEFNKLGFGKLDFTSWFTNIFMNADTNNVYVTFVNCYLNYFLLVEVTYFIPMIIYWFIHFGESVVEKFMNKE